MNLMLSATWQVSASWHDGGMFMGMHLVWWSIWIFTVGMLLWALWRVFSDRSETHRRAENKGAAEEVLRGKFAAGEIDEDEFVRRMRILRDSAMESR